MLSTCLVFRCQARHAIITRLHTDIAAKIDSLLHGHHPVLICEESLVVLSWHRVVLVSALPSTALAIIRHEVWVERSDVELCASIISLSLCLHFIPDTAVIIAVERRRLCTGELGLV